MELSIRLEAIAACVKPGLAIADIGTDHGYLPIELIRRGISPKALACDVRRGPLERAQQHIKDADLAEQVETRLSNGFEMILPGEVNGCVIAGMGGMLVRDILEAESKREKNILKEKEADIVLTPHIKEMSRLTKLSTEHILENRVEVAVDFAKENSVVVVLKGKNTIATDGESVFVNPTGNSGMAKGGSGDVLSGIIASFMAQGLSTLDASVVGVYIHGLSGDLAADELSKTSMLPSDIIKYLPQIFKAIE